MTGWIKRRFWRPRLLVLASTPEPRTWPFYGKALEVCERLIRWCEGETARNLVRRHYELVQQHLTAAERAVVALRADQDAMQKMWPEWTREEE